MRSGLWATGCVIILLSATGLWAQDITGQWNIESDVFIPEAANQPTGEGDCQYEGTADLIQVDSEVTGPVILDLVSATSDLCPGALSGNLAGTVDSRGVNGVITTSMQESLDLVSQFGDSDQMLMGSFTVTAGPFLGFSGPWEAEFDQPAPTLQTPALVLLVLSLIVVATLALRLRRRT